MDNVQRKLQDLLNTFVKNGKERCAQLAVYHKGKLVVDAWAGVMDPTSGRAVDGDTLFPVFSATKGIAATLIHMLVERGRLTYDSPIADVWPEFAAHGKAGITMRHALNHTAGLPYMPTGLDHAQLADWDVMCRAIADLRPSWPAGERQLYHAVTFSWLLGEVAHRVTGRSFPQLLADEIRRPLGITGMFCGIPDEVESRVAILEEPGAALLGPADEGAQPVPYWMQPLYEWMNRPDVRRACIPGSNGIMTARSLARMYAAMTPGGVDGVELLPPARVREVARSQKPANPLLDDPPMNVGLGYQLGGFLADMGTRATAFGHGGYGGSIGYADPEHGLAVGYTRNLLAQPGARLTVLRAVREALGIPH